MLWTSLISSNLKKVGSKRSAILDSVSFAPIVNVALIFKLSDGGSLFHSMLIPFTLLSNLCRKKKNYNLIAYLRHSTLTLKKSHPNAIL